MSPPCAWPADARAAISLTYDDNAPTQLEHAIPDLEAAGLRGTFYLITGRLDQQDSVGQWREASRRGHEMGNHTVTHPCRGAAGTLANYTPELILNEVVQADDWLDAHLGRDSHRSFAYPCGNTTIGPDDAQDGDSYVAAIRTRHGSARVVGDEVNTAESFAANPLRVNAVCLDDRTADTAARLIAYCQEAAAAGGWGVVVFHGIGGDWLPTSRETHRSLLAHLAGDPARYWVAPFRDVAKHLAR